MKITKQDIINSNITIIECGIKHSEYWFEDNNTSFNDKDFIILSLIKDGQKIEFSIDVEVNGSCRFVTSKGDGYYTPDFTDMEDFEFEVELSEPYSEDADIEFDIDDKEINSVLTKLVESKING